MPVNEAPIWEVYNNIGQNAEKHYRSRDQAVQALLTELNAVWITTPGSVWRIDAWVSGGNMRATIRSGPGANSQAVMDLSLNERSLVDFVQF